MGVAVPASAADGLTEAEAAARRRRGEANSVAGGATRSYATIVHSHVFSFYNSILFVIGIVLLSLGRYNDTLITVGMGLLNAVISAAQELRAKRKLDRLQLLEQAQVVVVRSGIDIEVPPAEIVSGDVLRIRPGDQIVVDGPLLDGERVEADESLLTGESEPVVKRPGEDLRSGSLCVAGGGHQLARDVGAASYAGRLTAEARRVTTDQTPLQLRINFVIRLIMTLTVLMSSTILAQALLEGFSVLRTVQITAVLSGLVPYGLFFLIAVAYTNSAVTIAKRGALVQQVNAVESLSNVDVVCTDKTGTLTTGRLTLARLDTVDGHDEAEARLALGQLAQGATTPNLTSTALAASLPASSGTLRDEVAFTSAQRWSAGTTDSGTWVLGAPEALGPHLTGKPLDDLVSEQVGQGLRVLLLARVVHPTAGLRTAAGRPALPDLAAVAVIALADELRPEVGGTIARFRDEQVTLKVISGDDPRTVAALAIQAGLEAQSPVSGHDLEQLKDDALDRLVARTTVFGRILPEQKERIVLSLRRQGHYVAMIGDGVNDARALKAAQVGLAMRSGSAVTRGVSDIVLLEDSFAALLPARLEGRRTINGIALSLYVYLARVATQGLVIVAVTMLGLGFPYSPTQVGLTLLTVGVPTLFLTFWARPVPPDKQLLRNLAHFVIPAAVVTAGFGTAVYAHLYRAVAEDFTAGRTPTEFISEFEGYTGLTYTNADFAAASSTISAQTGLSTFICVASFVLILFLAPPTRLFAAWTSPSPDRRPAVLVAALLAVFAAVLFVPALYTYFGLTGPTSQVFGTVLPALVLWFATLSLIFRYRLLERVLGLTSLPAPDSATRSPSPQP
jgi:cation-transporting P-type ATPase E